MDVRKIITSRETIFSESGHMAARPITRAVGIAVIENPLSGRYVEDLSALFDMGAELGNRLMPEIVALLRHPPVAYSKAAIVGTFGDIEHGHALVHPKLGMPMRAAVGGGKAVICSNVKVAAAGASVDMPFANKDNIWSFDDFCTLTIMVADAPRPSEIVVAMAVSDGGRPSPRIGKGPITAP